ncbi:hypothetical protein [Ruegeria sp.]|uniref:hypothetical protein n=1 Tax=Ruegeria sp. TaxID=1879320 RepID=UPI003B0021B5
MTRAGNKRAEKRTFYISCTDSDWEEAKRRASRAGMKTSPYLVERALTADLSIFGARPQPLVLSAQDQRAMSARIEALMDMLDLSPDWMERLGNQIAFLRDAKVTELIAEGRYDALFLAFEKLFGPDRAQALLARAVKEWHGAKSVEVKVHGPKQRM